MIHPQYTEVTRYPPMIMGLRWVWFHVCEWVALASIIVNFLPNAKRFENRPRLCWWYGFFVHFLAFVAINWRACLPSLDVELMGFRRKILHQQPKVNPSLPAQSRASR